MADDFQAAGICNGSWWDAARSIGFDAVPMSAAAPLPSCSVSGGSEALFSCSTAGMAEANATPSSSFQDTSSLMNSISGFSLSPSTMDWSRGLLTSSGRLDTSYHTVLQQDLNSRSFIQQDPPIVSVQDLSMHHLPSLGNDLAPTSYGCSATMINCQPSMMMGFSEISSEMASSWSDQFSQLIKPFPSKQPHPMDHSQISNTSQYFWNATTSASTSSGFYPPMSSQLAPQTSSQKRSSYDANMKHSNSGGARAANSCSAKKSSTSETAMKKPRIEMPSPLPTFKVRKEKLGDRVTALQQLVSPFGKTDTASVLHETIEYIKFLHDQVRGLTAPYLKDRHSMHPQQSADERNDGEEQEPDLRSRGLCLAPVASTYTMASEIPADFWTPTIREIFSWNSGRADSSFPVMFQDLSPGSAYSRRGTSSNFRGIEGHRRPEEDILKVTKQKSHDHQRKLLSSGDKYAGRSIDSNTKHDGYPRIGIPGTLGTDPELQQSVHSNSTSLNYQSLVSVIGRA